MEQLGGGRLAHQQQILGPLVPTGEELYQSWDRRGDEIRDSWDHLFLDASLVEVSVSRGTRRTYDPPPPPFSCCLRPFLVGFRAGLAGMNWTRATHSCEAVCSPSAYLCLTLTEARRGAGPGLWVPGTGPGRLLPRRWVV